MRRSIVKLVGLAMLMCIYTLARQSPKENTERSVLLEVLRTSWDAQRNETLIYLRVYSNGLAEAHPMLKVDFRKLELVRKQLAGSETASLRKLLTEQATKQLQRDYTRYWGNKDFGNKYDITIVGRSQEQRITLINFQPFLARKEGKPYPSQLEKLGCSIWRLRTEVSGEPLEKDWLAGCAKLGY